MIDRDRVKDVLFGIQLTCIFAFVGLGAFSIGWLESARAAVDSSGGEGVATLQEAAMIQPQPIPGWVGTALWTVAIVLVVSALVDLYLLDDEGDADVRGWLREAATALDDGEQARDSRGDSK